MKKILLIFTIMSLIVLTIGMASCRDLSEDSPDDTTRPAEEVPIMIDENLVGTWRAENGYERTFNADGTGTSLALLDGDIFTWSAQGNVLSVWFPNAPYSYDDEYFIDGDELTFTEAFYTFTRQ